MMTATVFKKKNAKTEVDKALCKNNIEIAQLL